MRTFLPLARLCLLVALLSLVTGIYAWLPLSRHATWMLFPMHIATMVALFCVFFVHAKHNITAFKYREFVFPRVSFPRAYWLALAMSLAYLLVMFIGGLNHDPHGMDLGRVIYLRIFSSGWLFLNLCAAGFAQWVGLRLRALKAAAQQSTQA